MRCAILLGGLLWVCSITFSVVGQSTNECVLNEYSLRKAKVSFVPNSHFLSSSGRLGVSGEAEVQLRDGGSAFVKADFKLPSIFGLNGRFGTYMIWAVLGGGSVLPLGPMDSDGHDDTNRVTWEGSVAKDKFGLLVTLEPHRLVTVPSTIVLSSSGAALDNKIQTARLDVNCPVSGKSYWFPQSDVKKSPREAKAEREKWKNTPGAYFEAKNAWELLADSEAQTLVPNAYVATELEFHKLSRTGEKRQIEAQAKKVIELATDAARAGDGSLQEQLRKQEKEDNDDLILRLKAELQQKKEELRAKQDQLQQVSSDLRISQQDNGALTETNRALRTENGNLLGEIKIIREGKTTAEGERDKYKNEVISLQAKILAQEQAQFQGPTQTSSTEVSQSTRPIQSEPNQEPKILPSPDQRFGNAKISRTSLRQLINVFPSGTASLRDGSITFRFDESWWSDPEHGALSERAMGRLAPLFKKLAKANDLDILIESHVKSNDDIESAKQIAHTRAEALKAMMEENDIANVRTGAPNVDSDPPPGARGKMPLKMWIEVTVSLR